MKRYKAEILRSALSLLLPVLLLLPLVAAADQFRANRGGVALERSEQAVQRLGRRDTQHGSFHDYNPEQGIVVVEDMVYQLHPAVRVKGTSTKLGLLSDIKQGETIDFISVPNRKQPTIPIIVEIRRR